MKLISRQLDLTLAHVWTIARTPGTTRINNVAITLTDTDGTVGFGEAAPVARYKESTDSVLAFLQCVKVDQLSFNDLAGSLRYVDSLSVGDKAGKCALDIALHDGAAKRSRKALDTFLGLQFRQQHHVTSFTIGIDTPEVIRRKVIAAEDFPVLKMKVGVAGDRSNLAALRSVAPFKLIRVDANEGWLAKEHALEMIQWLAADGHVQFVEQPMPAATSNSDWKWLKRRSPLPIFADESYHLAADITRVAECFHGVNVKLVKTGGVAAAVDALQAARHAGLKTMLGCMIESSILISAAAQLAPLTDYLDLDGNLLITNDPYVGVTAPKGTLSFADAAEPFGLRVSARSKPHSPG